MKVKINTVIYDSEEDPIMLILNEEDKELITNSGKAEVICFYPDLDEWIENDYEKIKIWMGLK